MSSKGANAGFVVVGPLLLFPIFDVDFMKDDCYGDAPENGCCQKWYGGWMVMRGGHHEPAEEQPYEVEFVVPLIKKMEQVSSND